MFKYSSAILFGCTMGFISLIPLQALNNHIATEKCNELSGTYTLVQVRAFAGTAKHCVSNAYL